MIDELISGESALKDFFESSAIGMAVISMEGKFMKVNPELCRMLGYTEKEFLSLSFKDISFPETLETDFGFIERAKRNQAHRYKTVKSYHHKNGNIVWVSLNSSLVKDNYGNPLYFISQIEDITERKKIDDQLRESELKFKTLVEKTLVGVYIIQNGKFVYVNPQFAQCLGYTQDEMLEFEVYRQIVDNSYNPPELQQWREKVSAGIIEDFHAELKYKRKDNTTVWAEVYCGETIYGGSKAILGSFHDITERRNAEEKIRERESLLTALFDNIDSSLALYDEHKKIALFNSRFAENYRLITGEVPQIGDAPHYFLSEEVKSEAAKLMDSALKGNREVLERDYRNNGKIFSFRTSFNPVVNNGKVTGVTSFSLDLTKIKESEMRIKESEEKFRMSFMTGQDAFYIGTLDEGRIIDANDSFYTMYGYTKEEAIGKTTLDLDLYANADDRNKLVAELKANGFLKNFEIVGRKKNGETFFISMTINLWEMNNEQFAMAVLRDITEQKLAEKKRIEILKFESLLSEIATNLVQVQSQQVCEAITHSQRLICEFLNLDLSSIYQPSTESETGLRLTYIYHRAESFDLPPVLVASEYFPWCEKELLAGNIPVVRSMNDLPAEAARDRESWHRFGIKSSAMFPMIAAGGEFLGTISFDAVRTECHFTDEMINRLKLIAILFANVIKRSRVELELIEGKKQLTLFVDYSPASLAMFDNDMKYIATSRRWKTAYNLGNQDIIGKSHYEVFPELNQEWKDIHQRCLKGAIEKRDEDSFTRVDGTTDWLKWEIRPWHKASGKIGGIIMFTEVITEQKESELKFKNLVEKSLVGVYIIQNGRFVYVNPKYARDFGYTQEEMLSMSDLSEIACENEMPDELRRWNEKVKVGIIEDLHVEARQRKKDGTIFWTEVHAGETLYKGTKAIIGTFQDITERKNAEAAINEQAEKNRFL